MKKLLFFLIMATSMISQQSCKKDDVNAVPITAPLYSLIGTWEISSMKISYGSSNYSLSATEIAKTSFPLFNIIFTDDGKYKTAQKSGTWTYVGGILKLDVSLYTSNFIEITTFNVGNSWIGFGTGNGSGVNNNPTLAEIDAISVAGTIMQEVHKITIPTSSKDVSYTITYKKK